MPFFKQCVIILLLYSFYFKLIPCAIYTSMYKIERAYDLILTKEAELRILVSKMEEPYHTTGIQALHQLTYFESVKQPFENPVDVLHFVESVFYLHEALNNSKLVETIEDAKIFLTTAEDVIGISNNILILQLLYNVQSHDLSQGYFNDLKRAQPMTSSQCYLLAFSAHEHQEMYNLEVTWLLEGLKKQMKDANVMNAFQSAVIPKRNRDEFMLKLVNYFLLNKQENLAKYMISSLTKFYGYHIFTAVIKLKDKTNNGIFDYCTAHSLFFRHNLVNDVVNSDFEADLADLQLCKDELFLPGGYCRYATPTKYHFLAPVQEEVISNSPYIRLWHKVLTNKEINVVINDSVPLLSRALVTDEEQGSIESNDRISEFAWLRTTDFVYASIDKKLEDLAGVTIESDLRNSEEYQANNYGLGGYFTFHYDYFYRNESEPVHSGCLDAPTSQYSPRLATALIYMSDVRAGGGTSFSKLKITVMPRKGSVLFWFNILRHGLPDSRTEHAGCPVLSGSKWNLNKWIHYHGQMLTRPCKLNKTND